MATHSLPLPISACTLTNDAANNAAAQLQLKTSSGGTLHPAWIEAVFDASTDEHIMWTFVMPVNYAGTPVVKVHYKCVSGTEETAAFSSAIMAVTDADAQDVDADAFDTINIGTATTPATAGYLDVISITMTNANSVVASDTVCLVLFRDTSEDNVTGDIEVINAEFQYSDS